MQDFERGQGQGWDVKVGNDLKNSKITSMDTKSSTKTFVVSTTDMETVKNLLSSGWQKQKSFQFIKERNNFDIEIDGTSHPIWKVNIKPKNEQFDFNDWKLLKDLRMLSKLGTTSGKKLYINEKNREELQFLVEALEIQGFDLIFDEDYLVLKRNDKVKIFKIAASMTLAEQHDGWYIGQKKVL